MEPSGPMDPLMALVARAGVDGRRLRNALAALSDGRWWTLAELVRETATSRRTIESLLREVELERSGDRFRLPKPPAGLADPTDRTGPTGPVSPVDSTGLTGPASLTGSTGPAGRAGLTGFTVSRAVPADPVAHLLPDHTGLVARMDELIAKAPRGRHTLDHVAATADTVVRRALLLDARFWLDGARLLCVGDHDLTSLATAMLHPGVEVTVVDLDERILAYIADQADRLGLDVRTRWADLRLGLPASAQAWADLVDHRPALHPRGRRAVRRPRRGGAPRPRAGQDPAGLRRERAHPGARPQGAARPVPAQPRQRGDLPRLQPLSRRGGHRLGRRPLRPASHHQDLARRGRPRRRLRHRHLHPGPAVRGVHRPRRPFWARAGASRGGSPPRCWSASGRGTCFPRCPGRA